MLEITVSIPEFFNEQLNEFIAPSRSTETLHLEHSLVSISKWESKWKVPYFSQKSESMSIEQFQDYVRCMTLNQNIPDYVYKVLSKDNLAQIVDYIVDEKTATWFGKEEYNAPSRQVVTSELIYYWMIQFNVPMECQKWHFSRLWTLIKVCSAKSGGGKKMSKSEILSRNRTLNEQRKAQYHTKG